ncbi:hypothetical protein PPEP_a4321 [Pseudoalteromonas peptidolytica F12-50-A1]|uniref:Uncharacterized protein n=1 Tax=Pseudoalteromonas peptidolytica F12-50-A1 TaxID=1315280 RepID=A0A8I0MZ70_9GAMM|nr:hypothetical protein [Pseudoalteromonas peptidolytica F12-50-A1]
MPKIKKTMVGIGTILAVTFYRVIDKTFITAVIYLHSSA